jgi:hypothetical protein
MIGYLWKRLWSLCEHEYEMIDTVRLEPVTDEDPTQLTKYVQRCEKCGHMKKDIL